ncbi:hypothetical protein PCH_Pc22g03010 [Penicillium rubens Wisconsin 54-1255]|uniref:Uncharacterized protein n=1 Tax=Penicillium rubens (strain ATCC 28089 / DSM 1075 / NRRL 1951 / Wisconsin 54-1255) TaxID=500485 RepID=B6HW58_PENRW|nr:hypothetical protein PCH_Pc22g03010 [Penicillium rubens Wisconsin 54-1255]
MGSEWTKREKRRSKIHQAVGVKKVHLAMRSPSHGISVRYFSDSVSVDEYGVYDNCTSHRVSRGFRLGRDDKGFTNFPYKPHGGPTSGPENQFPAPKPAMTSSTINPMSKKGNPAKTYQFKYREKASLGRNPGFDPQYIPVMTVGSLTGARVSSESWHTVTQVGVNRLG